jgi:hypothetical protein
VTAVFNSESEVGKNELSVNVDDLAGAADAEQRIRNFK